MHKINKRIEIVRSSNTWLSSLSAVSSDAILEVLSKTYESVGVTIVNTPADLSQLVLIRPDLVFLGMKFVPNDIELGINDPNKVWLSDFLNKNDIAYTGSDQFAHKLELNKELAKQRVRERELNTADFYVINQNSIDDIVNKLSFPVFIKPTNRGGGLGVDDASIVNNLADFRQKVESINLLGSDSLVEEYLPGREFSVAILKRRGAFGYHIMPLELIAPKNEYGERILSAEVKSLDKENYSPVTDRLIKRNISNLALRVFDALGARDYGRVDIRLNKDGVAQFLEANLLPSLMNGYGNFPKACLLNINLSYEDMILEIAELGFNHRNNSLTTRTILDSKDDSNNMPIILKLRLSPKL